MVFSFTASVCCLNENRYTMKKKYVSPVAETIGLIAEPLMIVVSGETTGAGVGNGFAGGGTPDLGPSRNGGIWF